MSRPVVVRFAPSPTGALHIGGVRTALYNYLFARHNGGKLILRIEDTDQTRFVPGAEEYIIEALAWVGIQFDEGPHIPGGPNGPYRQSERKPIYREYAEKLVASGHAYYAFDTQEEIEAMKKRLEAAGQKSPQYNAISREYMKNSLALPQDEVAARLASGEAYVIRMKIPRKEEIRFEDIVRGWVVVHSSTLDDKVLLKSDGMPTYHLANIVDDHLMEVSHAIRGEEWLPSTPLHVLLYRAFGWEAPAFAHLPLLLRPDGHGKLSKRDGDALGFPVFPLRWEVPGSETGEVWSGYREAGYLPEAFINFLALLGWNPGGDVELMTLDEMVKVFTLERVGKSGVKFDKAKAEWFNQHYIKHTSDAELLVIVKPILLTQAKGPLPEDAVLLRLLGFLKDRVHNLNGFYDAGKWLFEESFDVSKATIEKSWKDETASILQGIHALWASQTTWDGSTLDAATHAWFEANPQPLALNKVLLPLRYCLSGLTFGPSVFEIASLLGKERSLANLERSLGQLAG
jgi:glutamyl-tRNA synthetase